MAPVKNNSALVNASFAVNLKTRLYPEQLFQMRKIIRRAFEYYIRIDVDTVDVELGYDDVEKSYEYSFNMYDEEDIITISEEMKLAFLESFNILDYVDIILIHDTVLALMSKLASKYSLIYKPWGTLMLKSGIGTEEIQELTREIDSYSNEYVVYVRTPAVLKMSDQEGNYYSEFDNYVVVKLTKSKYELDKIVAKFVK
jgi:hypothetical protein